MIKTIILTLITIHNPTHAYKLQDITYERVVLRAEKSHDAMNICSRLGDEFVKSTPDQKDKHGSSKYARVYTCEGGSQLEWWLDQSVKKKETE